MITRVAAHRAADGGVDRRDVILFRRLLQQAHLGGIRCMRLAAFGAELAHQALRHHAQQTRRHQEGFDPHVHQTRHRANGVVGMQRGEHQMAGEARLHRDLRGFEIADFTDHDDVRVLAQDSAQGAGEGELYLGVHLGLADAIQVVFDGVFHRDDVVALGIQLRQTGIEGGGLARTRGAGHQNDAVGLMDQMIQPLQGCRGHT